MGAIGAQVQKAGTGDALARARQRAALLPDLLVEARRILNTVNTGWHGRQRAALAKASGNSAPMLKARPYRA